MKDPYHSDTSGSKESQGHNIRNNSNRDLNNNAHYPPVHFPAEHLLLFNNFLTYDVARSHATDILDGRSNHIENDTDVPLQRIIDILDSAISIAQDLPLSSRHEHAMACPHHHICPLHCEFHPRNSDSHHRPSSQ
jgi:hypothetical protein